MTTVAEIESAIEKLEPHEMESLRDWIVAQAEARKERMWSPEELTEGARQMVEEPDPAKAQILWDRVADGFYGEEPRA